MQIYSMPKRGGGAFQYASQNAGTSQMGPKGHILNSNDAPGQDLDNVNISVSVEASKGKVIHNNRQSNPYAPRADQPLANKYAGLGSNWQSRETNKFPDSKTYYD